MKSNALKGGIVGGLVYALIQAGFEHLDRDPFDIAFFLYNSIFFGLSMAFLFHYNMKKQAKNEKK